MKKVIYCCLISALIFIQACKTTQYNNQSKKTSGNALYQMPAEFLQTRWFTRENPTAAKDAGGKAKSTRKGSPCAALPAGSSITIADTNQSGTVRRIWATLWKRDQKALRGLKIEMYWDDAKTPAVQAPFGDFFCHSMGNMCTFENDCFSSPEGRSFNCYIPMPFRKNAKIIITNESGEDNAIYYEVDCTLGDKHDENMLYFHAYWRRENFTQVRRDMTILPKLEGKGRFLGCNLGVRQNPCCTNFWWGEGEVKIYLDGDQQYPTLCGTGTEDYIGDGYGQNYFYHRYQGNQYISESKNAYGFYRFHIPDPIYFYKDIRATIQVMGGPSYELMLEAMNKNPGLKFMKAGDGTQYYTREELLADPKKAEVMERTDDHCAMAYWYFDKPENSLSPLAAPSERLADLP